MIDLPFSPQEGAIMAISLPDARSLSDETLEALRLRALHACELGFTEADVADVLRVCRETVSSWWSAYRHGGLDALPQDRSGRPPGSGRLLPDDQAERVRQLLRTHPGATGDRRPALDTPRRGRLDPSGVQPLLGHPHRRPVPAALG